MLDVESRDITTRDAQIRSSHATTQEDLILDVDSNAPDISTMLERGPVTFYSLSS